MGAASLAWLIPPPLWGKREGPLRAFICILACDAMRQDAMAREVCKALVPRYLQEVFSREEKNMRSTRKSIDLAKAVEILYFEGWPFWKAFDRVYHYMEG